MRYDSKATKERILVAATTEFAERGIAGARIDRIAAQADANKRAIYDYFGDKESLFGAVLERSMTMCAEAVQINHGDMAGYARRLFDYHSAHPEMLRLQIWEALEYGTLDVPAEEARTEKYQDRVDSAAESFHTEPATLVFFAMALVNWSLTVPQLRRMVLGKDHSPERLRHNISEAVRLMTKTPPRPFDEFAEQRDKPADKPAEKPADKPAAKPADRPAAKASHQPIE